MAVSTYKHTRSDEWVYYVCLKHNLFLVSKPFEAYACAFLHKNRMTITTINETEFVQPVGRRMKQYKGSQKFRRRQRVSALEVSFISFRIWNCEANDVVLERKKTYNYNCRFGYNFFHSFSSVASPVCRLQRLVPYIGAWIAVYFERKSNVERRCLFQLHIGICCARQ